MGLLERLDMMDAVSAVKVTSRRRVLWLESAKAGDRWAVTTREGGRFSYGRTLTEALEKALGG